MKIVKIGAMWCFGCLITNKAIKQLKTEYTNIEFIELDIDMDEEEAKKYNYKTVLPEIIFIKDNNEVKRIAGEFNYEQLKKEMESIYE